MKTFVINLEKDKNRYLYIENYLKDKAYIEYEFLKAVNGSEINHNLLENEFDSKRFLDIYAKKTRLGQIGCTLSHRKCYKTLLKSKEDYCMILEDDILFKKDISEELNVAEDYMNENNDIPCILLLSGWFYFTHAKMYKSLKIASVYSAFLAHSYVINKNAAAILLKEKPFYVADDFYLFKKLGIKIFGITPHLINQDWKNFETNTASLTIPYEKGFAYRKLKIYFHSFLLRCFKLFHHFESEL